jgi:hypothetical protein
MGLIATIGIEVSQVRASAPARGHCRTVVGTECVSHAAASPTTVTFHFHVESFAAGPDFVEVQQAFAVGFLPSCTKIHPREVIEMPMLAGHHEAGRKYERRSPLCRAIVHVARSVRAIRIDLGFKQPGTDRGQQPAL